MSKISLYDIVYFLIEEIDTKGTLAWGFGGAAHVEECRKGDGRIYYEFRLEPGNRERQDHWHFSVEEECYDEDGEELFDVWQDWQDNWATPLEEQTENLLKERFPLLKNCGRGSYESHKGAFLYNQWQVDVDEKGFAHFTFHSTIVENFGEIDRHNHITLPPIKEDNDD